MVITIKKRNREAELRPRWCLCRQNFHRKANSRPFVNGYVKPFFFPHGLVSVIILLVQHSNWFMKRCVNRCLLCCVLSGWGRADSGATSATEASEESEGTGAGQAISVAAAGQEGGSPTRKSQSTNEHVALTYMSLIALQEAVVCLYRSLNYLFLRFLRQWRSTKVSAEQNWTWKNWRCGLLGEMFSTNTIYTKNIHYSKSAPSID